MMICVSEQQRGQAEDEEIDMGNNADNTGMLWPANNNFCLACARNSDNEGLSARTERIIIKRGANA